MPSFPAKKEQAKCRLESSDAAWLLIITNIVSYLLFMANFFLKCMYLCLKVNLKKNSSQ